ncbi:SIR2 family protein [Mesorhizobium sp. M0296]|uniref:SIR2 family protein n=1 Tax=Mesorhizobium sp. M0296 TaxID=2956931 RepID=UPI003336D353
MAKKKLLIVTGAGSTLEFGMPSVAEVGDTIKSKMQACFPLANRPGENLYGFIEQAIRKRWNAGASRGRFRDPNFEDVLYTVFAASGLLEHGPSSPALSAIVRPENLPDFKFFGRDLHSADSFQMYNLGSYAIDSILDDVRERCRAAERDRMAQFDLLQSFIAEFNNEFEVAMVTLNYDNVMHRAMSNAETGFDPRTRRCEQERLFLRPNWSCMLHLHGSIHFDMPIPSTPDMHEIFWQPDINAVFSQNSSGRSGRTNPEGTKLPTSAIVAGYGKTTQILRRPFRTYYAELDRLVGACDAFMLAGYGFGDPHLNIAFERFRDSRRRPVAIIGYAKRDSMTLGGFDDGSLATGVVHTFDTDLGTMRWLGHSCPGERRAKLISGSSRPAMIPARR